MTFLNTQDRTGRCRRRVKKCIDKTCTIKTLKRRLPIVEWLPKYQLAFLLQDIIAGLTVGLAAIPQGIAFAIIAGLPPEHGLYASLTSGVVYIFFGSCFNVTVGPTAILAAMTAKYVANYSIDFAILVAFLSGVLILLMGVLKLGFLVEFISMPVITGFTIAAALQIAASQLKSLFGLSGSTGEVFADSVYNFFYNIKTTQLWDPVLGFSTMAMLILLKELGKGCKRNDGPIKQMRWFISLSRNAIVVLLGMILAYALKVNVDEVPLAIIGDIGGGLPKFSWPPFNTVVANETYYLMDMLNALGPQSVFIPFIAVLETVAIAKAFSESGTIDASQEMIAIGLCNIIGSFGQSMPITGSFTRTALNHVSGVKTPAGGVTKVLLIVVALTYLSSTFYYIPKASLAGLIIIAMFSMIDYALIFNLWKNSKKDLLILLKTMGACMFAGLEYGIMAGVGIEAALLLYKVARPTVETNVIKSDNGDLVVVPLTDSVSYCAAEHIRRAILRAYRDTLSKTIIIVDGTGLKTVDYTVASNLMSVVKEFDKESRLILFLNFNLKLKTLCIAIEPKSEAMLVYASNATELSASLKSDV